MEHITLSELRLCQEYLYERISTVADSHMVVLKLIRNQDLRQGVHPQIIDVVFKREIFEVTRVERHWKKTFYLFRSTVRFTESISHDGQNLS